MGIDKVFIIGNWYFTALSNTKYSIEKTSFLWCNANVLRLNAPLVFVSLTQEDGFAATCFGE